MSHDRNTLLSTPQYLEVKDAHVHSIGRLAVGQEAHVVEDAAHCPVRGRGFGLGGQEWSIWVYCSVQVSDQSDRNRRYYAYTFMTKTKPET